MLFDDFKRSEKGIKRFSQSLFDYLNSSANEKVCELRKEIESWFERYPEENKNDLRSRFRSNDDVEHIAAFFELFNHELLLRLGFKVNVNPKMSKKSGHPDFLALCDKAQSFYVEATVVSRDKKDLALKKIADKICDELNKTKLENFYLGISILKKSNKQPCVAKWRREIEKWINELTLKESNNSLNFINDLRTLRKKLMDKGWELKLRLIPRSISNKEEQTLSLGFISFSAEFVRTHISIRNAIKEKAKKYKGIDLPFIVSLNIWDGPCTEEIIRQALFGDLLFQLDIHSNGSMSGKCKRRQNGAWIAKDRPINRNVSGVLVFWNLSPFFIKNANPILWHNPWAYKPIDPKKWPLDQMIPVDKKGEIIFNLKEGGKISELF